MRSLRSLFVCLFILVASACTKTVELSLPPAATVAVYDMSTGKKWSIQPNTAAHRSLGQWAKENQDGWQPYLATPPAQGIFLRAEGLDVQFVGDQVLLHSRQGVVAKKVKYNELAFLSV